MCYVAIYRQGLRGYAQLVRSEWCVTMKSGSDYAAFSTYSMFLDGGEFMIFKIDTENFKLLKPVK